MNDIREEMLALMPHLRTFARSLTRGDPHATDDLVQDTLMLALQAWERFTPGTNLKAWLFRILHNRFHSLVTRKHVTAEIVVDDLAPLAWVPGDQESRIEMREFRQAFARLSPSHREVLVLQAVHGLSLEQIAGVCGCKVQAVKSRMNRARTKLKEMLYDGGLEPTLPTCKQSRPCPSTLA